MEANLDTILDKMRTAGSEENLKKSWKNALSSLDDIRTRYEFCSANLNQFEWWLYYLCLVYTVA